MGVNPETAACNRAILLWLPDQRTLTSFRMGLKSVISPRDTAYRNLTNAFRSVMLSSPIAAPTGRTPPSNVSAAFSRSGRRCCCHQPHRWACQRIDVLFVRLPRLSRNHRGAMAAVHGSAPHTHACIHPLNKYVCKV